MFFYILLACKANSLLYPLVCPMPPTGQSVLVQEKKKIQTAIAVDNHSTLPQSYKKQKMFMYVA